LRLLGRANAKEEEADAPAANSNSQIPVVEDESMVDMMIEDMLIDLGHQRGCHVWQDG
jgi:hypothetical protein